jgi:WD40 repeat protein
VEIGAYGKMRILVFPGSYFQPESFPSRSVLIGVSREGDALVVARNAANQSRPANLNEVNITTLDGRVTATIHSPVRGFTPFDAELSPDRRQVAFSGSCDCPHRYGLHLLADNELRTLASFDENLTPKSVSWSDDGGSLVYDSDNRIYIYHLDQNAGPFLVQGNNPSWSPGGEWIAYSTTEGFAALISPDGKRRQSILPGVFIARGLRWSPDGQYLLFTDARTRMISVYSVNDGRVKSVLRPLDATDESRLRWIHFRSPPSLARLG